MTAEEALRAKLVTALPGVGWIGPAPAPEAQAHPLATYQLITSYPEGSGAAAAEYWYSRYQVTVWSAGYAEAADLAADVAAAFLAWSGTVAGTPSLIVHDSGVAGSVDLSDALASTLYGRAVDVWFWWEQGA